MDKKDPAWKLAEAAHKAAGGDVNALKEAFQTLKPDAVTVAQAQTLCLTTAPFSTSEATRLALNAMQSAISERGARKLILLTWVLVALTVALLFATAWDIYSKANSQ